VILAALEKAFWIAEIVVGVGLIIFIHELGHFIMAKRHGVRVEIFSLGFGPALFKRRRGDTEYRISLIPLGGYVKMAGEQHAESERPKPDELVAKGPWVRFQIFVAGALMNLVLAFPILIATGIVGKWEFDTVVGAPGTAESLAGILPGDRILSVEGRPVKSIPDYKMQVVGRSVGTRVAVEILRDGRPQTVTVEVHESPFHQVEPAAASIALVRPGSPMEAAGVRGRDDANHRAGDAIAFVNDRPVLHPEQYKQALEQSIGRETKIRVRRPRADDPAQVEREIEVTVVPQWKQGSPLHFPADSALQMPIVGKVAGGTPAAAPWGEAGEPALRPGDRIARIEDRPIKSWLDLRESIKDRAGKPTRIALQRDARTLSVTLTPAMNVDGHGVLGLTPEPSDVVADVRPGSYYDQAGLKSGDRIVEVGGKTKKLTVNSIAQASASPPPGDLTVRVERPGQPGRVTLAFKPIERRDVDLAAIGVDGEGAWDHRLVYHRRSFSDAVAYGFNEPVQLIRVTWTVLGKLLSGRESPTGLAGPVGIFQFSYKSAEQGFGNLLWILGLITVNLGIFNLLPVPLLDGGHIALLPYEVIFRRRPSLKFEAIYQWTGLILLLSLVIFVTWNDFVRILS
jgi:regulator of sigma E protease